MDFVSNLKNSLYNPRYYAALKEGAFASSFRYFFSLIALISITTAFVFGVELAPVFSAENLRKLASIYPSELKIQLKGGLISTNVTEPYGIKEAAPQSGAAEYTNTVVIDTKNDFSVEQFRNYDTRVLIGKNFIVTARHRGQFEFNDLSRAPDFSLSQQRIFHWIDLIAGRHLLVSLGLFALLYLSFFVFFSLKLIGLLVASLIIFLLAKIKQAGLSYKNSYQIGLHASTAPLILQTIFILAGAGVPFPFFFSIILLVIAFANIKPASQSVGRES